MEEIKSLLEKIDVMVEKDYYVDWLDFEEKMKKAIQLSENDLLKLMMEIVESTVVHFKRDFYYRNVRSIVYKNLTYFDWEVSWSGTRIASINDFPCDNDNDLLDCSELYLVENNKVIHSRDYY